MRTIKKVAPNQQNLVRRFLWSVSVGVLLVAGLSVLDVVMIQYTPGARGPIAYLQMYVSALTQSGPTPVPTPISTSLQGRVMVGYQGWFAYPGMPSGWNAYTHWSRTGAMPNTSNLVVDMWPETSEYPLNDLKPVSLTQPSGAARIYSAASPSVVDKHVQWMSTYNIDGAFIQRFVVMLPTTTRALPDAVIRNFRTSAEARGRTYAVMYDLSGATESTIVSLIQEDWRRLVDAGHVGSPSYQNHKGKPIVGLWGVGFAGRPLSPQTIETLVTWFKSTAPAPYRASVLLGVDTGWRTGTGDAASYASWERVYSAADVISPWTVGRFSTESQAATYYRTTAAQDKTFVTARNIDYMPVVFPGFSWRNLTGGPSNQISRRGGSFLWSQVREARQGGHNMLYGAMFDEIDEGTALYKVVAQTSALPANANLIALDVDGYPLPSDWYLQIMQKTKGLFQEQQWVPLSIPRPNTIPGFVEHLYRSVLGRGSDAAGKANYVAHLEANRTVAACRGVMTAFYSSGEFLARVQSDREFVNELYRAALAIEPDDVGASSWAQQITSGAVTRAQVRDVFIAHPEAEAFCKGVLHI